MLSSGLRIPLLSLLLLLLFAAMELSWSFTDEEKKLIVDQHNRYRSLVSPPAANMLKMHWDSELEAFAKNYSTKCTWEHNKQRGFRGENLFAMTGNLDLDRAVYDWYIEYKDFNYSTLACEEGRMCGHYTQVVWASSERVGCGTTFCETMELLNDTDMHLFVCNYQPPGNIVRRKPYVMGTSCSMCPDGYFCNNNLCDPTAGVEETSVPPTATTILTASPEIDTEAGSEPPTIDDQDTTSGSQMGTEAQPIVTEESDVDPGLQAGTDAIDESLMSTTSATPFVNLIPSSTPPETETEKTTGTQASLIKTVRPITTVTTTKTPSTPKLPTVPKPPSVPKPPTVPKTPPMPKTPSVPKPPSVTKPHFYPKPPPMPIKRPLSKKPSRYRLMAYSKAIQSSSNSFQSSAE